MNAPEIIEKMVEKSTELTRLYRTAGFDVEIMFGSRHVAAFSFEENAAKTVASSICKQMKGKVTKLGRVKVSHDPVSGYMAKFDWSA